jgi:hypothetical protein
MTSFLSSVKADLLDRRILPLVALVLAALVAAIAFVVFGGGSSTTTPPAAVSASATASPPGLAVSQPSTEKAVAEVTSGGSTQHHGASRNPFSPLPEAKAKSAAASTTASGSSPSGSSSSAASGSGSASSSPGSSGSTTPSTPSTPTPSTPTKPTAPTKPKTVYHVAVLFGALSASVTSASTELTPYENLKLLTPLPSGAQALVVFRGVTAGGKSATFTVVGEAILHGNGACLPSASQCEAIDLQPGQAEQLEYLPLAGQAVTYELKVVNIVSSKASSAAFKDDLRGASKAGRELLSHAGLQAIPYLRYSATAGVLVFAGHRAFAASAHSAGHSCHSR